MSPDRRVGSDRRVGYLVTLRGPVRYVPVIMFTSRETAEQMCGLLKHHEDQGIHYDIHEVPIADSLTGVGVARTLRAIALGGLKSTEE